MMGLYHELSRSFCIQDEDKLFSSLREVKSSRVIKLHDNINEIFQVQAELISKFQHHIDELGPVWMKIWNAINDMYQKTKKYKVWLQEHNESTSVSKMTLL